MSYICLKDEAGREIPGSRRKVDYAADRETFIKAWRELEQSAGEGCWVFDSERDA